MPGVFDSDEGRWTIGAAIDEAAREPVLANALYARFPLRGNAGFQDELLAAMRFQFGGHAEKGSFCMHLLVDQGDWASGGGVITASKVNSDRD